MSQRTNSTFRCEQCQRHAGPEMIACPERPTDMCPYELEDVAVGRLTWAVSSGIVLAIAVVGAWWSLRIADPFFALLVGLVALGLGVIGIIGVLFVFASPAVVLVNRDTGASWTRVTLAGRTFSKQITTPVEPLNLGLVLGRPLAFPASIAAVRSDLRGMPREEMSAHAMNILESALVALLAQDLITVKVGRRYESYFGRPLTLDSIKYLLEPGPRAGKQVIEGELEGRLLRTLLEERYQGLDTPDALRLMTANWQFPPRRGMEARVLIYRLFDRDELEPYRWLVELVHADAVARDVLHRVPADWRRGHTRYDVTSNDDMRLRRERIALREMRDGLWHTHPDFMRALRSQMERACQERHDD